MANDKPIECENAIEDEIEELERRLQHAKARLKAVKLDDGSAQTQILIETWLAETSASLAKDEPVFRRVCGGGELGGCRLVSKCAHHR